MVSKREEDGVHSALRRDSQDVLEFHIPCCSTTNLTELQTLPSAEQSIVLLSLEAQGQDLQTLKPHMLKSCVYVTQCGECSVRHLSAPVF